MEEFIAEKDETVSQLQEKYQVIVRSDIDSYYMFLPNHLLALLFHAFHENCFFFILEIEGFLNCYAKANFTSSRTIDQGNVPLVTTDFSEIISFGGHL